MATLMDELWCDNLWKNMTHEAIQNFDWTYTKNYEEGQEEENILGGTRMEGILKIWGRCYDDLKRYVDGISLKNCITYDSGSPNLANAELSDKAELLGWEVYSTKLNRDDNMYITNNFCDEYLERWYDTKNIEAVSQNMVDNDFMNRLVLSSGEIFRTKGTKHAIEMTFGLFGIGNNQAPRTYYYASNEIPQRLDIDNLTTYTTYNKPSDGVFEFYIQNMSDVTIIAVPYAANVTLKYRSNGIESIVTECEEQPCLVDITSSGLVNNLPEGYRTLLYYFDNINVDNDSVKIFIE